MWSPHNVNPGQCQFRAAIPHGSWDVLDRLEAASRPRPPFKDYSTSSRVPGLSWLSCPLLSCGYYPFICWAKVLVSCLSSQYLWLTYWEGFQLPCQWWVPVVSKWHHRVSRQGQAVLTRHQTQQSHLHFKDRRETLSLSPRESCPHTQREPNSSLPTRKKQTIKVEYFCLKRKFRSFFSDHNSFNTHKYL